MKKGKKGIKGKIVIGAVIIALAGAGVYHSTGAGIEVSAFDVAPGEVERLITETGSVEASSSAVISSRIQGQLLSVAVKEGDTVTEGQRIASYTEDSGAADIGGIRAQISGLTVQLNQAKDLAGKSSQLYQEGAMSYDEYSEAQAAVKKIESQISALNYSITGLSESAGSKGVIAPISGTVTQVMVREGEIVSPGAPMIEISDISDVHIKVNLVSEDADEIAVGNAVRVKSESDSLIDGSAKVKKIYIKAQDVLSDLGIVQKRVPVEISLSGNKNLRLGRNLNVEIIVEKKENVLRIPDNAIFEINRERHVFIIENGKAKLQSVEIGLEGEKFVEIISGLSAGDKVITSPAREVEDGKAVKAIE